MSSPFKFLNYVLVGLLGGCNIKRAQRRRGRSGGRVEVVVVEVVVTWVQDLDLDEDEDAILSEYLSSLMFFETAGVMYCSFLHGIKFVNHLYSLC